MRMNALNIILLFFLNLFAVLLSPFAFIIDKEKSKSYRNLVISFGHLQKKLANKINIDRLTHFHCRPKRDLFSIALPLAIIKATTVFVIMSLRYDMKKINNMSLRYFGDLVLYMIYRRLLHNDMKVLIHFNDHYPLNLILQRAAQKSGIKTVYIQHASVTKEFPILTADINLLFSKDSWDKYRNPNNKKVKILSDLRFVDAQEFKIIRKRRLHTIMIVFNKRDDINIICNLATTLSKRLSFEIILRPHPDDNREKLQQLNHISPNIKISDADLVNDLGKCDVVLLNETNVILECLFYKRPFILTTFLGDFKDHYDFYKSGLVLNRADNIDDLLDVLSSNEEISVYTDASLSYYFGSLKNGMTNWLKTITDICAE